MHLVRPIVGTWYRGATNDLFEVVAVDEDDGTIELQYFDGTVEEMEFDAWNSHCQDDLIEEAEAPEDWSGSVDIEPEYLGRDFEDGAAVHWAGPHERSARRQ